MANIFHAILDRLLHIEHSTIAYNLGFSKEQPEKPSFDDVCDAVKALNQLSLEKSEENKNIFITIAALLWEYAVSEYPRLRDILILLLSRIGYAPSSVILDSDYLKDNKFAPLCSMVAQIATGINQKRYEVSICGCKEMLTEFQLSVSKAIRKNRIVGISAPTSAGKSYVLLIEAIRALIVDKYDVIYIVPTISLINQVTLDFTKYLYKLKHTGVEIFNAYNPEMIVTDKPRIFVLTQERAAAAFSIKDEPFSRRAVVVVDEIQNIERIANSDSELRSKILLDTIYEFRFSNNIAKFIISGARINQIGTLSKDLLGDESVETMTNISPVLNLTYSIAKTKDHYDFKQYSTVLESPKSMRVSDTSLIKGHGNKRYDNDYLRYLSSIITSFGDNYQNIIFVPKSSVARDTAIKLSVNNKVRVPLDSLSEYLRDTVRDNYALADTVLYGVAYHHGKLPQHVRKVIEYAISKKQLRNVVCTTTLMQGVNMPAQNVIVRNPHLYINRGEHNPELSSYEMANLRGRAGRLLKDFIGRTFVLDEDEFLKVSDEYTKETLFEDTYKELDSSYQNTYRKYSNNIIEAMADKTLTSNLPKEYAFIVTHIRQTILRHGDKARKRLYDIGIDIPEAKYVEFNEALSTLQVSREICHRNRYVDPEMLNIFFLDKSLPNLPINPMEKGAKDQLKNILEYLRDNFEYTLLFNKSVPKYYQRKEQLSIMCDMSIKWTRQVTLKEILKNQFFNNPENVDRGIDLLLNTISYDLPMLLKPLYDIKNIEPNFISYLESGAYHPIARKLIEIGIPRETAIYLYEQYFKETKVTNDGMYDMIVTTVRKRQREIPYWIKVQLLSIGNIEIDSYETPSQLDPVFVGDR